MLSQIQSGCNRLSVIHPAGHVPGQDPATRARLERLEGREKECGKRLVCSGPGWLGRVAGGLLLTDHK